MKVLYFHQYFGLPSVSMGSRSYGFARGLIARGHQVTMVAGGTRELGLRPTKRKDVLRGDVDGIDIIQIRTPYDNEFGIWRRTWAFLQYASRSVGFALKEEYDLVFATSTPLTASIPGIAAKLRGRPQPFVFEVRDLWPELPRAMGMKNPFLLGGMSWLEKLSYAKADACVGLSPGICKGIARRSPPGRRIIMIPNSADLELFQPGDRGELRIDGVARNDLVAAFTGAHGLANGLDAVLDAAVELSKRGRSDIKLLFIGEGKLKPQLVERARRDGLTNCIFMERMPQLKLSKLMNSVDVGLMILANLPAFYYGTSPNKFFDYLAAGLPILNNYPGWVADIIGRHECGVVVPPDNPAAFADALCTLADDPERRRVMGRNSRKLAEAEYNRGKLGSEFVTFLEEVYERSQGGASATPVSQGTSKNVEIEGGTERTKSATIG